MVFPFAIIEVDVLEVEFTDLEIPTGNNLTVGVLSSPTRRGMLHILNGTTVSVGSHVQHTAVKIYNGAIFTLLDSSLASSDFNSLKPFGLEVYHLKFYILNNDEFYDFI